MPKLRTTWVEPEPIDEKTAKALSKYPAPVRQLLFNRGLRKKTEADIFLNPSMDHLVDPEKLHDVAGAVEAVESAIVDGKKIFIHGDFDADGINATTILWNYLYRVREADALPYIPSRIDEGYGMSEKSLQAIRDQGGQFIISVDCGIRDAELIEKFSPDLEFVVTDHHELGDSLPKDIPIVHPLHPDGSYPFQYISGAMVAWKLVAGLEKKRNEGTCSWEKIEGIDLAAFATVCDLMPLTDENRALVKLGLEKMNTDPGPGIRALAEEASIPIGEITAYHLGYVLGPRINASGRIGDPLDAVRLLATKNSRNARELARKLGKLNRERQEMTDELMAVVRDQIEQEGTGRHLYFAHGNDWPEGIIGLVAGKIQEEYHRPVVIVTEGEESSRGSARSIPGFNIIKAIEEFRDLLERQGGHDQAAGFTIDPKNIGKFRSELEAFAEKEISEDLLEKEIHTDLVADIGDLDWELMNGIEQFQPYGYGNRKPVLWVKSATVVNSRTVGDGSHLKLSVKDESGDFLDCIFFRGGFMEKELKSGISVEMIGYLEVNSWNGKDSLQFNVREVKVVE